MARRFHETLAFQRNAGIGEEVFDFRVNDRVMTVDGFPGQVVARNSGPFPGTEDYEVVLDGGMGGGSYTAAQLKKINPNTAALHEAAEVTASIPVEAVTTHTADVDYPELGDILYVRPPNENVKLAANKDDEATKPQSSQEDPGERMDQQDTDNDETDETDENTDTKAAEEPENEAGKGEDDAGPPDIEQEKVNNTPDVTPPSACSFCGADAFEDPQMTGRGVRMRCAQCGGTMKSWGGQWEPEFPNSSQNHASGESDWSQGGAAGVANAPGANFKTTKLEIEAGIINWIVDKIYDRIEERKDHALLGKEWAWQTGLEGLPHYDHNYADYHCPSCGVAHPQSLHPEGLTIHGALASEYDSEWGFHFTASWQDVQAKAKRIRKEGGVKILVATNMGVAGEVKGDHNVYETQLNYVLGTKHVADWACGCKWASYTWGRSPAYRRFEGRLCSHALALQYEASARGMFGREIQPDTERPHWQYQRSPVQVQHQRGTEREPERELRRRAVPPGNMRRTYASGAPWGYSYDDEIYCPQCHDKGRIPKHVPALMPLGLEDKPDPNGEYCDSCQKMMVPPKPTNLPPGRRGYGSLDTDGVYESPELLDLHHAPIFAAVQTMAANGEPTENIIEMVSSYNVNRAAAKEMLFEAFHVDEDGLRRDGDEYETPDGDRFNHGDASDDDDKSQWDDPEYVRANQRDLTDHDDDHAADEHKKKHHRTNDAREHAPHWGWGLPAGVPIMTCPQCNGVGCGHCAGQGQIVSTQNNLTAGSPDQTSDAGDVVSGLATNGVRHTADDRNEYGEIVHPDAEVGPLHVTHVQGEYGCGFGYHEFVGHLDGHPVAHLSVNVDPGERPMVDNIEVNQEHRHKHFATMLFNHARSRLGPIDHSGALTDDGRGWRDSLSSLHTADYSSADPLAGVDQQTYYSPTNHSNSKNPASTGWATSEDPGDWGRSVITNNFGLTTDSALKDPIEELLAEHEKIKSSYTPGDRDAYQQRKRLVEIEQQIKKLRAQSGKHSPHNWNDIEYSYERGMKAGYEDPTADANALSDAHEQYNPGMKYHFLDGFAEGVQRRREGYVASHKQAGGDKYTDTYYGGGSANEHRFVEPGPHECKYCGRPLTPEEQHHGSCIDCGGREMSGDIQGGYLYKLRPGEEVQDIDWAEHNPEYHPERLHTMSTLVDDPDEVGALPYTTGEADGDVFAGQTGGSSGDTSLPHASTDALHGDQGAHMTDALHQAKLAFWESPAAQKMMAEIGLNKTAMKDFSYAEQQELINEGNGIRARNFTDLKIAGTHYEHLADDEDGDLFI
jgi:hypothetical protein